MSSTGHCTPGFLLASSVAETVANAATSAKSEAHATTSALCGAGVPAVARPGRVREGMHGARGDGGDGVDRGRGRRQGVECGVGAGDGREDAGCAGG